MKTYSQMAEDVFIRRDKYEESQRKKKTAAKRVAISACCCLVAAVCVGVYHTNLKTPLNLGNGVLSDVTTQPTKEDVVTPDNEKETTVIQGALPVGPNVTKNNAISEKTTISLLTEKHSGLDEDGRLFCYLNKISGTVAAHPLYLDPDLHYTERYSDEESAEYYGLDLEKLAASMPEDMNIKEGVHRKTFENNGTLVQESSEFVFKGDGSRAVYIRANRLGAVSDCLYMSDSDLTTRFNTRKNGCVEVKFFIGNNMRDCETFLVADFIVDGVNYRVETEDLHLTKELKPILEEMIGLY